jgi:hypothetical protein
MPKNITEGINSTTTASNDNDGGVTTTNSDNTDTSTGMSTGTLSNFTFSYPDDYRLSEAGWLKVVIAGDIQLNKAESESSVYISTNPAPYAIFNPKARSLDDYMHDYPVGQVKQQVRTKDGVVEVSTSTIAIIHSQEKFVANGIPILRQIYSFGYWEVDSDGKRVLSPMDTQIDHDIRYIFFDGKTFVIIDGWQSEKDMDQIARSVRLIK